MQVHNSCDVSCDEDVNMEFEEEVCLGDDVHDVDPIISQAEDLEETASPSQLAQPAALFGNNLSQKQRKLGK